MSHFSGSQLLDPVSIERGVTAIYSYTWPYPGSTSSSSGSELSHVRIRTSVISPLIWPGFSKTLSAKRVSPEHRRTFRGAIQNLLEGSSSCTNLLNQLQHFIRGCHVEVLGFDLTPGGYLRG